MQISYKINHLDCVYNSSPVLPKTFIDTLNSLVDNVGVRQFDSLKVLIGFLNTFVAKISEPEFMDHHEKHKEHLNVGFQDFLKTNSL